MNSSPLFRRIIALLSSAVFLLATGSAISLSLSWTHDKDRSPLSFYTADSIARTLTAETLGVEPNLQGPDAAGWILRVAALSLSELSLESSSQPPARSGPQTQFSLQDQRATPLIAVPWAKIVHQASADLPTKRLTIGWVLDTGTADLDAIMEQSPGLSVLAPKWLEVDSPTGALTGQAESGVVQKAHELGIQVWAVVDNGFDGPMTHQFLAYQDRQDALVRKLVTFAVNTGIAGINVDFEGLLQEDRWNYARFIDVLATALHKVHKSLSVDLPPDYVSGQNNGPYNHAALAKAANYIILMGYDEHWGGDPAPGPTASLPWVQSSVTDMLDTGVPADKLILGVPFYTQDWTVNKNGEVLNSQALSLWQVRTILAQYHVKTTWNKGLGLRFGEYTADGQEHQIWVEDDRSLLLTLELIARAHLAGAAAWYLGLEYPSTWLSLVDTVRSSVG